MKKLLIVVPGLLLSAIAFGQESEELKLDNIV